MSFEPSCAARRGFTLLEVVCTLIILGVLGGLVFSGFGSALRGYAQMKTSSATFMQAELALIRLQKELSGAFDDFTFSDSSPEPFIMFQRADGVSVIFSRKGESLFLKEGNTVAILLNGVSEVRFTAHYENGASLPDLITVSFTLQTDVGSRDYTLSVSPRNTPPAKG